MNIYKSRVFFVFWVVWVDLGRCLKKSWTTIITCLVLPISVWVDWEGKIRSWQSVENIFAKILLCVSTKIFMFLLTQTTQIVFYYLCTHLRRSGCKNVSPRLGIESCLSLISMRRCTHEDMD